MNPKQQIEQLAREKGVIRPRDLISLKLDHRYLLQLVAEGRLLKSGRGLYTLADFNLTEAHSLVEATSAQSNAVICLLSALNYHGIGTRLPHKVWVAIPYGKRITAIQSVPLQIVVLSPPAYEAGIEKHSIEGVGVQIYSIAKTIADCFKFRNKVGMEAALEALREAIRERRCSRDEIHKFAKIDRVEKVMTPYLEALS